MDPEVFASTAYNRNPSPVALSAVRERHAGLFSALSELEGARERSRLFADYMSQNFGCAGGGGRGRTASLCGYLRHLLAWMGDSNSSGAAALKWWASSRFGLAPTYHRSFLGDDTAAWEAFSAESAKAIDAEPTLLAQFDLLYEFVQFGLSGSHPAATNLILYRGVLGQDRPIAPKAGAGRVVVRLNNLNSFTRDFERAWEFGSSVLEASVPLTKVFYDETLAATGLLEGEEEVIVLGGEYEVSLRWY